MLSVQDDSELYIYVLGFLGEGPEAVEFAQQLLKHRAREGRTCRDVDENRRGLEVGSQLAGSEAGLKVQSSGAQHRSAGQASVPAAPPPFVDDDGNLKGRYRQVGSCA